MVETSDGRTEEAAWYGLEVGAFAKEMRLSDDDDDDDDDDSAALIAVRRKSCEQGILQPIYEYVLKLQ